MSNRGKKRAVGGNKFLCILRCSFMHTLVHVQENLSAVISLSDDCVGVNM